MADRAGQSGLQSLLKLQGPPMSHMAGKVGMITGASSGIGRATAEAFAAKGARVMLAARREVELASLMEQVEASGVIGDDLYDQVLQHRVHTRCAGRPEEIARSIVFLCSDDASYVTGTTLTPDGGFTLTT